ncbi:MAG: hypothetical protein M3P46_09435, partial [Actinomycetota bacterium]|nr:hypothetical protein [Actinomycetota bacterium]
MTEQTAPSVAQTAQQTLAAEMQNLTLLEALHSLHRLTATEVAVAGIRSFQARDDALRTELRENRQKAREREALIAETLRKVGGVPTPLSPALGKGLALLKAQVESGTNFTSALLSDLTLETTLLERARFTRRLAERLGEPEVVMLCEGLERAHGETVEWIRARLDELADTGQSRLRALPTQVAVGFLRKAALAPVAALNHGVRRARSGSATGSA